jgi:hypothetical protein
MNFELIFFFVIVFIQSVTLVTSAVPR